MENYLKPVFYQIGYGTSFGGDDSHGSAWDVLGVNMIEAIRKFVNKILNNVFKKKKHLKLGLYGPPNGGKTTLANRICMDWLGEEMGSASNIAHETREIQIKEQVNIQSNGKELSFNLVDTPGIATKIDYEEFMKKGMGETESKTRAKEATKGIIDAIKWLDDMDAVVVVLDSTIDPMTQVNITIIGNLAARDIPVLIAANKCDLKKSDLEKIKDAFPQYDVVGISAKRGDHINDLYEELFKLVK